MSKFQHSHDNVLTESERAVQATKCIRMLLDVYPDRINSTDWNFFQNQKELSSRVSYSPTQPQLNWLKDMVQRYVTE